ncbi:MAG TPA: gamma carbonic anhydrase family protein [Phycisphaerae bacterium]|nr:gamma carbonic anhydrase family protein [Phycisphaerae bacterium]HNU46855.1 gamma carbonic anhydrase family protein [Phycisphaerae bacterium]
MDQRPQSSVGQDVFIADSAVVAGDVMLGDGCTVMHQVVIRADIARIRIGARVNVQDGTIIHTPHGVDMEIGDDVGIGHRAVVHGRRIGARTLIGIGAIVLDHCEIGSRCIVAAGAVLTPGTVVPDGKVVMGTPGRVVREVGQRDLEAIDHVVRSYLELGARYRAGEFASRSGPGGFAARGR